MCFCLNFFSVFSLKLKWEIKWLSLEHRLINNAWCFITSQLFEVLGVSQQTVIPSAIIHLWLSLQHQLLLNHVTISRAFILPVHRCSPPNPPPTTALTCVLRCFPCEPTWAGSPFLHRPPTPPMVRMTRSKTFQAYLPSCHRTYSCIHCRAHLANHDELISKVTGGNSGTPLWWRDSSYHQHLPMETIMKGLEFRQPIIIDQSWVEFKGRCPYTANAV